MRILMTGASGLVGKQLGIALVKAGHELTILSRGSAAQAKGQLPFPCQAYTWQDVQTPPPSDAIVGIDAVIHLAGEPIAGKRWTTKQKQQIASSRIDSTTSLVQAFAALPTEQQPKTWVQASAIGFYGSRRGDAWQDEAAAADAGFLGQVCERWEAPLRSQLAHTRKVWLRIGVVLSARGGFLGKILPIFRSGLGGRVGSGQQWLSWIHLNDLVKLNVAALADHRFSGVYNAVAPTPVTNSEFTARLAKILQRPALAPAPSLALKTMLGEMAELAVGGQRVSSQRLKDLGFKFDFPDISVALDDLCDFHQRFGVSEFFVQQWVPYRLEKLFPFFSDEKNLEILTPPWLGFKVLRKSTAQVTQGTLIDYKLKIHGAPVRWRTRIEEWTPPHRFVDTQLKGPYQLWHHTHTFEPLGNGTLLTDRVFYKLPLWPLGIVAQAFVNKDVQQIFAYRRTTIAKKFASDGN